jgi:hypothetical protein
VYFLAALAGSLIVLHVLTPAGHQQQKKVMKRE